MDTSIPKTYSRKHAGQVHAGPSLKVLRIPDGSVDAQTD